MIVDNIKDPKRLKLCFDIKLIGSSTVQISSVVVDHLIWEYPNKVFYICSDGYVFEKSETIKYSIYRLQVPYQVSTKQRKEYHVYTFTDDETRYAFVKKLKQNLLEFTKSGFFGYNPEGHVLTYNNFWFVY
jgi:hypothetical protein